MEQNLVPLNGMKIRALRKRLNWPQKRLAYAAGCSRSYIAEIERGTRVPRRAIAFGIARALDVDINEITLEPLSEFWGS